MNILVYGDLIIDETIEGDVNRVSPEAPCLVVNQTSVTRTPGGAANVAANIAAMMPRARVQFVAPQEARYGIDRALPGNLIWNHYPLGSPAPIKRRIVSRDHQLLRLDIEDPSRVDSEKLVSSGSLERILTPTYDAVVIADYRKGACSEAIIKQIMQYAEDMVIPVFVDAKPGGEADVAGLYGCANIRKWNRAEAGLSDRSIESAMQRACELRDTTTCDVIITLDRDGAVFASKRLQVHVPAESVDAIDPTGAGDTFLAGLVAAYFGITVSGVGVDGVEQWIKDVLRFANKAAARAVSTRGTAVIDGVL